MSNNEILKKYWGYSAFRRLQEDIINSVMAGNDTLALMPTGGGKSMCFQVPALAKEGTCIVVSPLIALMKDQVANLRKRDIKAMAIYSGMTKMEIDQALDNCIYGNYKFLYVSPERLATEIMQVRAAKMNVNLLAVDEAHCISQWGYDFRPPYLKISLFREIIPKVPVIALTATATSVVVTDICEKLKFRNKQIFQKSFERKNLSYSTLFEENKNLRLVKMLEKVPGTAIVYVRNRRKTREISEFLEKKKISSDYYHAGLDHTRRSIIQDEWMKNKARVIVCTNAFGMGIDKPDVRMVVHMDVPDDIESYFQEAGRAGRDGRKSFAVLLYNNSDLIELTNRLTNSLPTVDQLRKIYQSVANDFQLAIGSGENVSFDFDLVKFCKSHHYSPLETLRGLKLLEQEGFIAITDAVYIPARLMITVNKEVLYKFEVENQKYELLIRTLLRSYSGIFEEFIMINEEELAQYTGLSREQVIKYLAELQQFHLLQYESQKDAPQIVFTLPRADSEQMLFDIALLNRRKQAHESRLTAMRQYLITDTTCRSQFLLSYFCEETPARCGICDVCLKRNKLELSDLEFEQITQHLENLLSAQPFSISEIIDQTPELREQKVLQTIQWLIDNDELHMNEKNQLIFRS